MKVAFITVSFETHRRELVRLKKEVKSLGFEDYVIYIINNSGSRRGYAEGVNLGIRKGLLAGADLFIIMNPDISFESISKKNIIDLQLKFAVGGFAMRQNKKIYYRGTFDRWRMSTLLETSKPAKRFVSTDYATGSFMVIRRETIDRIGFFDESYGMYYEDADYCQRAKKSGLLVGLDTYHSYTHFASNQNNHAKNSFLERNRFRFLLKHGSLEQKLYEVVRFPKTILEKRGSYFFNFLSLNFSSLANKALQFGFFLVLIHFFSPADYGLYTLVWAQVSVLSPVVDMGTTSYGLINIGPSKNNRFFVLFALRFLLACGVFGFTILLAIVGRYNQTLVSLVFFSSFIFFSNAFSGSYLILNSVKEKLYRSSIVSFIFNLLFISICTFVVFVTKSLYYLFFTSYILYVLYSLFNIFLLKREISPPRMALPILLRQCRDIIKKSLVFVLIGLFAGFYYKADIFLLTFLKGTREVGIYSTGYKFFDAFMFMVASYNLIAAPVFAKLILRGKNELILRIKKDILHLLMLGLFVVVFAEFVFPLFLPYLFKSNYLPAIPVIRIVILSLPFILLTSVFLNAIYVLKKAYLVIIIFAFQTLDNISLNLIFIPKFSYLGSSWITVVSELINTLVSFIIFLYVVLKWKQSVHQSPARKLSK